MTAPIPAPRRQSGDVTTPGRGTTSAKTHDVCLVWVRDDSRLCALPRYHDGTHLPFPTPWPVRDVSATNPPYDRGVAACMERHPAGKAVS